MSDEQNPQPVEETVKQAASAVESVQEPDPVVQAAPEQEDSTVQETTSQQEQETPVEEAAPAAVTQEAPAVIAAEPAPVQETAVVSEPAPAVTQAVLTPASSGTSTAIPKVPSPQENFDAYVDWVKNYGTSVQKEIVRVMDNYYAAMQPGRLVKDEDGAKTQYALFTLINGVLNTPRPEEFVSAWNTVLAYYNHYRNSVFGIRMVNRFLHMWPGSQTAYNMLLAANNLIMLTADPKTRANSLKQVNLDKTMRQGFTDLARQRAMEFYA